MLALVMMMAAAIEVRRDGPPITLEQAGRMTPAELADALLTPDHPAVVEAGVGPEGMRPPPPPGMPTVSEIRLFTAAKPASEPGFCEKTRATVTLEPVSVKEGDLPPARPQTLSVTKLYRWAEQFNGSFRCEEKHYSFFELDPQFASQSFAVIRLLDRVQRKPSSKVTISIDDQEARSMRDYVAENPSAARDMPKEAITPITNGRAALAKFPTSDISHIRSYVKSWDDDILKNSDLQDRRGRTLQAVRLFAGGVWEVGVVLDGDTITTIRFVKAVPPPF
jgi:hypothetical protein